MQTKEDIINKVESLLQEIDAAELNTEDFAEVVKTIDNKLMKLDFKRRRFSVGQADQTKIYSMDEFNRQYQYSSYPMLPDWLRLAEVGQSQVFEGIGMVERLA